MVAANLTLASSGLAAPVGVSFGGAGFLIFYYIGVVEVLSKLGVLSPASRVAGASSGALITTSQCSGLSPASLLDAGNALAGACRAQRACSGSLDRHLRATLHKYLPEGAYKRCNGSGWISISSGSPLGPNQGLLVGSFASQEDLVDAAATSSYIPLWSSARITAAFRGAQAFDGGYTISQPCPPGVATCIRIASRNPEWGPPAGIGNFLSVLGRVASVLDPKAALLSDKDEKEADAAAQVADMPPFESTGPNGTASPEMLRMGAEDGVDIAPGIFHKIPWSREEWSDMAMIPATLTQRLRMFELGKADAAAWARHAGVTGAPSTGAAATGQDKGVKGAGDGVQKTAALHAAVHKAAASPVPVDMQLHTAPGKVAEVVTRAQQTAQQVTSTADAARPAAGRRLRAV